MLKNLPNLVTLTMTFNPTTLSIMTHIRIVQCFFTVLMSQFNYYFAGCCYTECSAEGHSVECHSAECHSTDLCGTLNPKISGNLWPILLSIYSCNLRSQPIYASLFQNTAWDCMRVHDRMHAQPWHSFQLLNTRLNQLLGISEKWIVQGKNSLGRASTGREY